MALIKLIIGIVFASATDTAAPVTNFNRSYNINRARLCNSTSYIDKFLNEH